MAGRERRSPLALVGEPHQRPHELVVDSLALHDLRVRGEREAGVGEAQLAHHPARVTAGGEGETGEGPTERVRCDVREEHLSLGRALLVRARIAATIVHFAAFNAGVIALVKPLVVDHDTRRFYLPAASASPVILALLLLLRRRVGRGERALLTGLYAAHIAIAVSIAS